MEPLAFMMLVGLAAAPIRTADAPAAALSRYPAGSVPDSPAVHAAIDAVATREDGTHLALLHSLVRHEHGAVRAHAIAAVERVSTRALSTLRASSAAAAPDDATVQVRAAALRRLGLDASTGELSVVAYASAVTADLRFGPDPLGSLSPDAATTMVEQAETLELQGRAIEALPWLIDVVFSGHARARHGLLARGIDVDRLTLGLSSPLAEEGGLPVVHVPPPVQTADPAALRVLLHRAGNGPPVRQLAAIDNLGLLLEVGTLDDPWQARAREALARATTDQRAIVRLTAQDALSAAR
jgi:hypothetical protein